MKNVANWVYLFLLIVTYVALPIGMISGWVRWAKHTQPRSTFSILSLVGFTFASASALLAVCSILFSLVIGGFPFYDPLLLRIYGLGGMLSIVGILFAITGAWQPNLLRWYAPAWSLGMLMFWLMMASFE